MVAKRRGRPPKTIGRPPIEVTGKQWKVIEEMASYGRTHDDMADYLGITKRTFYAPHLREQFERVTKMALAKRKLEIARARVDYAISKPGSITGIWVDKNILGWTDRQAITGGNGGPLEFASSAVETLSRMLDKLAERRKA